MNEGLTNDDIICNLDTGMFENVDNFYDDHDHTDKSKNDDDIMVASTYRVVK